MLKGEKHVFRKWDGEYGMESECSHLISLGIFKSFDSHEICLICPNVPCSVRLQMYFSDI